jgi:hypothetical protein
MTTAETTVRPPAAETAPPKRRGAQVPRPVVVAAALLLAVNVVVMFAGGWLIGVSIDEPVHVQRLQTWFATGFYLPPSQMDGSVAAGIRGEFVYAPVAALISHAVTVLLGAESWGDPSMTAEAYAARHVAIGLFAAVGLAATAAITRLLLGSWRWALVAAAILSCIPVWPGHAMFNIKDIPVATGYTLVTLGVVVLSRPRALGPTWLRLFGVVSLAAGALVAIGTRPGMTAPVVASVVGMLLLTWWGDGRAAEAGKRGRNLLQRMVGSVAAVVLAYLGLLLAYPKVFAHPARVLEAVADSSDYPWDGDVLTNGVLVTMPPPRSYLPLWFFAQTPVVVMALSITGLAAAVVLALRLLRPKAQVDIALAVGVVLVSAQALIVPLLAVARDSILYDATRQVLFVVPAMAVLATVGAWVVAARVRRTGLRVLVAGSWSVLVLGLLVPTVTALGLFPYSFTWFNAVTAAQPIDGRWMTEYWRPSFRELIPLVPAEGPDTCYPFLPETGLRTCSNQLQITPYWDDTRGTKAAPVRPLALGEYYFMTMNRGEYRAPDGCTEVGAVRRPLFFQQITMSFVARCQAPFTPYPAKGIVRTVRGQDPSYLMWGWYRREKSGVWSKIPDAAVGFVLPERLRSKPVSLTLDVGAYVPPSGTRTFTISVNGTLMSTQTSTTSQNRKVTLTVPADLAWSADGKFLVETSVQSVFSPVSVGDGDDVRTIGVFLRSVAVDGEENAP